MLRSRAKFWVGAGVAIASAEEEEKLRKAVAVVRWKARVLWKRVR